MVNQFELLVDYLPVEEPVVQADRLCFPTRNASRRATYFTFFNWLLSASHHEAKITNGRLSNST